MLPLWLLACGKGGPEGDTIRDTAEPDADVDTDADSDADVDDDTDQEPAFCADDDDATDDLPAAGTDTALPACATGTIECGDSVTGVVEGGSTTYTWDDYDAMDCVGPWRIADWGGPERVFLLRLPADRHFGVALESCGALGVRVVFRGQVTATSPDPNGACEAEPADACTAPAAETTSAYGMSIADLYGAPSRDTWHEIVVDTMDASGGEFTLTVTCE
jgi:hypothetical protein